MIPTASDYISFESACENPVVATHVVVSNPITPSQRATIPAMSNLQTLAIEFEGDLHHADLAAFSALPLLWSLEIRVDRLQLASSQSGAFSFAQLRELTLAVHEGFSWEWWTDLLAANPLQKLDLRCDTLDEAKAVGEAIKSCNSLHDLQLYRADDALLFGLCGMEQLRSLSLESGRFGDGSFRALCFTSKQLEKLRVGATPNLTTEGMRYLTEPEQLKEIALHECGVDAGLFVKLATIPSLETIEIGLEMSPSTIPTGLHIDWPVLRELNIAGFSCPRDFAKQVLALPTLRELRIHGDIPPMDLFQGWQGRNIRSIHLGFENPQAITFSPDATQLEIQELSLANAILSHEDLATISKFQGLKHLHLHRSIINGNLKPLLDHNSLRSLSLPKSLKTPAHEALVLPNSNTKVAWLP